MKNKIWLFLCLLLSVSFIFSACKDKEQPITQPYVYNSQNGDSETKDSQNYSERFKKNTNWQSNYSVSYKYYNSEQGSETLTVTEKKCSTAFLVEYEENGMILYYVDSGSDTDFYSIIPSEKKNVHSVLKNTSFSSLSSLFMKLSDVDESMPLQSNVLYVEDEQVSGRDCHKYIQRGYKNGEVTETVYVWIDAEFGFAAKCESYNAEDKLIMKWEIDNFKSGVISLSDVEIDLSEYSFTEE